MNIPYFLDFDPKHTFLMKFSFFSAKKSLNICMGKFSIWLTWLFIGCKYFEFGIGIKQS